MASIELPSSPGIQSGKPRLLDFGAVQTPPGGGASTRLNRTGNRFGADYTLPALLARKAGRIFVSRLIQAQTQGALFGFWQERLTTITAGSPVVHGAGQLGSILVLSGFTPNYTIHEGVFFSIVHAGRHYLHMATTTIAVDNTGAVTLPIAPMLRISPADGDVCEFDRPKIEGWLSGNAVEWSLRTDPYIDLNFTITEAA